jgi:hypothetical protein
MVANVNNKNTSLTTNDDTGHDGTVDMTSLPYKHNMAARGAEAC